MHMETIINVLAIHLSEIKRFMTTFLLLLLVGFSSLSCSEALSADRAISLTESCRIALPPATTISGGAISNEHALVLWQRESRVLWKANGRDSAAVAVALSNGSDIVAAAWVNGQLQVVDGGRRQILQLGADGQVARVWDVVLPIRLHAAARLPTGWVVGGSGLDGGVQIAMQRGNSFVLLPLPNTGTVAEPDDRSSDSELQNRVLKGDGFYLSQFGADAVLASWAERPHRTAILKLGGSPRWLPHIPHGMLGRMEPATTGWNHWTALPAVSLGNEIAVQVIADLGSMNRELIIRDGKGAVVRMTRIEAPWGIVAASPNGRTVLAVSRVPTSIAVCYQVTQ
jgi:hypothetical protein